MGGCCVSRDHPVTYARGTEVSVERSQTELARLLDRAGCRKHSFSRDNDCGLSWVVFVLEDRQYRIEVPQPTRADIRRRLDRGKLPKGWLGWDEARRTEWVDRQVDQHAREAWRLIVLVTKAKLELVAAGFSSYQEQFLASLMLPDGALLGAAAAPAIAQAYESGSQPALFELVSGAPQLPPAKSRG